MFIRYDSNNWIVEKAGYSDMKISKMLVVGHVEYIELTAAVAKVVLEHIEKDKQ